MRLSTNQELEKFYQLNKICVDKQVQNNMYHFIRLIESLTDIYNSNKVSKDANEVWLQNIAILTSSLIEAVLKQGLLKLNHIATTKKYVLSVSSTANLIMDKSKINSLSYSLLIDNAINSRLLKNVSKSDLDKVRKLRNNIHISKVVNIVSDQRLTADTINKTIALFSRVASSISNTLSQY